MRAVEGWTPPPYPQDRLGDLRSTAAAGGDLLDLSVGDPCDPVPPIVAGALIAAVERGRSYPASIGFAEFRQAAADWMARRLDVAVPPDQVTACVGTKEAVASLPRWLALRDPSRDTVLYPAVSYPTYAMGAELAGLRAVPVPLDDDWLPRLDAVDDDDAARTLLLWLNEPGNPTGSAADGAWYSRAVAWARERGVVVASDECYVEFSFAADRATALSAGSDGVLAVHSLSKRSNMAGFRAGFMAGDAALVRYLGEVRKHAGLMMPGPVQVAAAAALADDEHVEAQCERYAQRRALFVEALEGTDVAHVGGPATFYLWLARPGVDGWRLAETFARAGILAAPGDLYGKDGAPYLRVALVAPVERLEAAVARLRDALAAG